ncbi:uncharacterized protein LOC125821909 [Solanum verrucosum]|uniref:uncharacterized protein LOC125821909 n=1 Tax=Solanum verrucosum TaxID=315347 RepID=UPI0020D09610|nr:uncharacterized protein LOC125821909 [Solanum verrucosum]
MANSSHVRSISFPSRSQPEYLRVEIELNRLKTWESTSISSTTTPFSLTTIQQGLVGLAELYNCVQDLLESPMIQQALLKHQMGRLAEEALEASVGLIDSCSTTRELVLMMKEQVQDLQSALRRKVGDSSIQTICSTKTSINLDHLSPMFPTLFLVFASFKGKEKRVVIDLKMLVTKSMTYKGEEKTINEVECVDFALCSYLHSSNFNVDVSMIQRKLQILNTGLQAIEAGTECLSRLLIRNRVCLLNILTH